MPSVLTWLERLNYKERCYLFQRVTGGITLGEDMRQTLSKAFLVEVPRKVAVYIDYHLDWLHAALEAAKSGTADGGTFCNSAGVATGTQRDVDLLVAFQGVNAVHLLMLEAKLKGGWNPGQLAGKLDRLTAIFGKAGGLYKDQGILPHFGLVSPDMPPKELNSGRPGWMTVNGILPWIPMPTSNRYVVYRSDEKGRRRKDARHYRLTRHRT